jgi:putative LysE/RhtB family amino acid efflux pump
VHALVVGIGLGAGIGAQIGPMSLFLIRNTLRSGWVVGLAIGFAIAVVDGLYAAAGVAGVAPLLDIAPLRLTLGLGDRVGLAGSSHVVHRVEDQGRR